MARYFAVFTCSSVIGLVACDDTGSPAKLAATPHDQTTPPTGDPRPAPPPNQDRARATQPATPTPQPNRACAAGVNLPLGNTYASLVCLPHLDEINYWEAAPEWAAYDAAPVDVAILDLSFIVDHPDINKAVNTTWNFLADGCTDFDIAKTQCRDVAPAVPNPPPAAVGDEQLMLVHGTMLAGLIAGRGEPGKGIVGVNPSAKLDLFVRDLNTDNLTALKYAIDQHVDVISMSWPLGSQNGEKDVPAFKDLLETATKQGTVVVMAAGNSHVDVDQQAVYPTRYSTIDGVIAVGSIDLKGDFYAQFSNYGPDFVEIGAPGTAASSGGNFEDGHYSVEIGSSYSGPMVAGAVSRVIQYLKSKNIAYTPADVEQLVVEGSPANPKLAPYFKDGRTLDMSALLAHVKSVHP